ncbi:MAG: glycosyltransferase [Myxococcales bacterium]|nr:glycosyltransferase [Myxococcales bacterium]
MGRSHDVKVSILTPAFNHERFVEQSIRSAWAQTHSDVEHIIVDDCSTDGTPALIERVIRDAPIPTRFIRNVRNVGPGRTVNLAFEHSTGDWVCFLASDDAYAPWKLEKLLAFAQRLGPDFGVLHGDCWAMDEVGAIGGRLYERSIIRPAHGDVFLDYAMGRVGVNGLGVLIRRDVFQAIGGNDPVLLAEDFDFYLRLARITRFAYLNEGVAYVRALSSSLGRNPTRYMDSVFAALERQREALGGHYREALHTLHLRAFDAYARFGPMRRAVSHGKDALMTASDPGQLAVAARHIALGGTREAVVKVVSPYLPGAVRDALRRLNRGLMRRTYGARGPSQRSL